MSSKTLTFALFGAFLALSSFAHAADPVQYRVDFAAVGNRDIEDTLAATSDLKALRSSAPVSPFGLIARARSDVDRLTTVLESFGYYECRIVIKINGAVLNDPNLGDALIALPKGAEARVAVSFILGTLYHLRRIDIEGEVPESINAPQLLGLTTGQAAVAATVLAGGARLLTALQEAGYAFAKVDPPVAFEAADGKHRGDPARRPAAGAPIPGSAPAAGALRRTIQTVRHRTCAPRFIGAQRVLAGERANRHSSR
jgi:translocation and assembly module TamA